MKLENMYSDHSASLRIDLVIKGAIYILIIIGALFGNALVLIALTRFHRLRKQRTNLFLISLALADLIVAIIVMPFNASMALSKDNEWYFGKRFCDVYNANDVLFSTSSILHLCSISTDRYIAIIHPLKYESRMTRKRIIIMLCLTWTLSILISYIPILFGLHEPINNELIQSNDGYDTTVNDAVGKHNSSNYSFEDILKTVDNLNSSTVPVCNFIVNPYYATLSSSVSFWIPAFVMILVYIRIFLEAKRQQKKINQCRPSSRLNVHNAAIANTSSSPVVNTSSHNIGTINSNIGPESRVSYTTSTTNTTTTKSKDNDNASINNKCKIDPNIRTSNLQMNISESNDKTSNMHSINSHSNLTAYDDEEEQIKERIRFRRESKAAITLGLIVGAFLMCWLPFFIWYTVTNLCTKCTYPNMLQEILFWIGYLNSTLNPLIYAFYNKQFRKAFIQILKCHTKSMEDPYYSYGLDSSYKSQLTRRSKAGKTINNSINEHVNNNIVC